MKLSAALFLAALASPASAEFYLRTVSGSSSNAESTDVRIIVHGMNEEASKEDLDIIGTSVVSAYNHAYKHSAFSMDSLQVSSAASIPDNIGIDCRFCPPDDDAVLQQESGAQGQLVLASAQVGSTIDCRFCPPDDDAQEVATGNLHHKFEQKFCAELRASGSANFAQARDCSFSFLDMPGQSVQNVPIQAEESTTNGKTTEAQVSLQGTLHELSEKDLEIVDESVVAAYNEAFSSAGYSLDSFKSFADLDLPSLDIDCRFCPPDDDSFTSNTKLVLAKVTPVGIDCRFCPPDDDATVAATEPLSDTELSYMHEAFEKAFCHKLQNSGEANFAIVHDCTFRFVYSPVSSDTEVAQQ